MKSITTFSVLMGKKELLQDSPDPNRNLDDWTNMKVGVSKTTFGLSESLEGVTIRVVV